MKRSDIVGYILLFLGLIALQVIVLNNLDLGAYIKPQILVLFILLLPIDINKSYLLLLAFIAGLTVDFLMNTNGLNTSGMLLVAFIRGLWLPKENNPRPEFNVVPSLKIKLNGKWMSYILLLTTIFHFNYFVLEFFNFKYIFRIFTVTILSTIFCIFVQWIIFKLFLQAKNR